MAKIHDMITDELQKFSAGQHMFFVSTAPLSADGHVIDVSRNVRQITCRCLPSVVRFH